MLIQECNLKHFKVGQYTDTEINFDQGMCIEREREKTEGVKDQVGRRN